MSLPRFEYLMPSTLSEALSLAGEDSAFVAGGTDLLVRMKDRLGKQRRLIGLGRIAALQGVDYAENGEMRIGAAVRLADVAEAASLHPGLRGLREAILLTASPLLRNAGTLGGNLCQDSRCRYYNQPPMFRKRWPPCLKLGGDICHVIKASSACHAVYSGDLAGILMVLKATAVIAGSGGERTAYVGDLFSGSGLCSTILKPDEIIKEIRIPKPPPSSGLSYQKLRLRDTIDFPILGLSLFLEFDSSSSQRRCRDARLVLSAAGPQPLELKDAASLFAGREISRELVDELGARVRKLARPVANTASTPGYRRDMVAVLTRRAFRDALEGAA